MIGSPKAGGAETFAWRLMVALQARADVELLAIVRKGSWLETRLRTSRVPVVAVPFGGVFDFLSGWCVRRILRGFNPAIVQSWMNRSTRFVPKGPWRRVGRLGGFYNLKYYKGRVEELVCNTPAICDYCIENGWPAEKVAYIGNFIPEPVPGWREGREETREALGIADNDCALMMAGRLHAVKGIDVAMRALARLPEHFVLLLVGEGPARGQLEALSRELGVDGRVRWVGWVDEVSTYAAAADVWLAPSLHEPLGNTVLDAWVHGLPVVASDTGGLAFLIQDGENGLLVPVGDANALADAVGRLWADGALLDRVVAGGKVKFEENFSARVVVEHYMAYYRRLSEGVTL